MPSELVCFVIIAQFVFAMNFYVKHITNDASLLMSRKISKVRPSIDDVERISRGQAASKRGVGSRAVPHRLNELERREWVLAKERRYLLVRGTGWRHERGDSPLANIYRNYCDAIGIPCISVFRSILLSGASTNSSDCLLNKPDPATIVDKVIIDFSPLRTTEVENIAKECITHSSQYSSRLGIDDSSDVSKLGWSNIDMAELMNNEAIWKIPVFCVSAVFSSRAESKAFAESIANKYCYDL